MKLKNHIGGKEHKKLIGEKQKKSLENELKKAIKKRK